MKKTALLMVAVMLLPSLASADGWRDWFKKSRKEPTKAELIAAEAQKKAEWQAAQQAEHRQRIEVVISEAAPKAEAIENLGLIDKTQYGTSNEMNDDQYYYDKRTYTYYVRVQEGKNVTYYGVTLCDEKKWTLTKTAEIEFKHTVANPKSAQEDRKHVAELSERFASLFGVERLKPYLAVFAKNYPLTSIVDFVNSQMKESDSGWWGSVDVKLANGVRKTVKLHIRKPHGTSYWWHNEYSVTAER